MKWGFERNSAGRGLVFRNPSYLSPLRRCSVELEPLGSDAGEHARGGSWHRAPTMLVNRLPWRRRALPSATLDKMRSKL